MNVTNALDVRLISERVQIPLSAEQWNALVAGSETNTVFQTFEWFDSWWNTFGNAHCLFLLLVSRAEQVVGLAALMLRRTGLGIHQLEFVGTGNADYQDIVASPADKREVVEAICAFLSEAPKRWHRTRLCNIPSHSTTLQHLECAGKHVGLYFVRETKMPCPALRIEGKQEATRQLLGKYSVRRPLNWFTRRGVVRFRHLAAFSEIEALLPKFFDQHIRRWSKAGGGSLFKDERQQRFYRTLARAGHECGWLLFSVVEFDDEPIAFHFGFDYARVVTWYKPSFETRYSEHSPGLVLIHQLIEDAVKRERREIDFTIGNEPFKKRFADEHRSNLFVGVYRSRLIWLAAIGVRESRRMLGKLVRLARRTKSV